jgi:hypothetical protein
MEATLLQLKAMALDLAIKACGSNVELVIPTAEKFVDFLTGSTTVNGVQS